MYSPNNATANFPSLIAVAGNTVYSISGSVATSLGTITGTDTRVSIAGNFDRVAIVANGCLWLYGASTGTTANSFRQVAIPTPYTAADVTSLNDYFIIAMTSGVYYWLVPGGDSLSTDGSGSSTDPALHFATAESSPDGLVGVTTLLGNLMFIGATSIEVWQTVASADQPFERLPTQGFSRGCLSRDTIAEIDNSIFFCGEDAKVYRISSVPDRISATGIEERLKKRTGLPSAITFSYSGHLYYCLSIPGQGTFCYDISTQIWTEFASENSPTWRPHVAASIADQVYVGDSETGAIWTLSDSATDAGSLIRRTVSASVVVVGPPARNDDVAVDIGASGSCEVRLRWADADETLDDQLWVSLDAAQGSNVLSYRRLGAARQPYRQFEIEITDPVLVRLSSARIGDVWR